jgi:hypothetical protein
MQIDWSSAILPASQTDTERHINLTVAKTWGLVYALLVFLAAWSLYGARPDGDSPRLEFASSNPLSSQSASLGKQEAIRVVTADMKHGSKARPCDPPNLLAGEEAPRFPEWKHVATICTRSSGLRPDAGSIGFQPRAPPHSIL